LWSFSKQKGELGNMFVQIELGNVLFDLCKEVRPDLFSKKVRSNKRIERVRTRKRCIHKRRNRRT